MDVPEVRRVEVPRWVNTRTVVGLLLFFISFLGAQRLMTRPEGGVTVWVAERALSTGDVIERSDLSLDRIELSGDRLEHYAVASTDLVGSVVTQPVAQGELVALSGVARTAGSDHSRRLTIPIEVAHAVGGSLRAGDRVDVFSTVDGGRLGTETFLVASDVEITDLVTVGGLVGEESAIGVTVSVSAEDARRLVEALRSGAIDIVQITDPSANEVS